MAAPVFAGTILLAEDEVGAATEITLELERNGYRLRPVSPADVAENVKSGDAALLILDRIIAGEDSLRTLADLRNEGIKIPALMISALSSPDEVAKSLRAGADDCLAKPFHMAELVARVEALLRRFGEVRPTKLRFDDLEIDLIEQIAFQGGTKINLVRRELTLLEYFLRRPGQVISRATLLDDLWHCDPEIETNVVDAQVSNLRKKIDEPGRPSRIANIRGMGYMLRARQR